MNTNARDETLERMLQAAYLKRRKGDLPGAWRCIDDALVVAPKSAAVLEAMGLLYLDDEQWAQAQDVFEQALALEPGRRQSEIGLGQAVVELKRREPRSEGELLAIAAAARDAGRQAATAAWFSLCIPGLGQMRLLEFGRGGAALLVEFVILLLWKLGDFGLEAPTSPTGHAAHRAELPHLTALFWMGILLLGLWHMVAAADANRLARIQAAEEMQRL